MEPHRIIPVIEPWLDQEEEREVAAVVRSGWITEGERTRAFEARIAELTGARHVIAVCNGTMALYMALKALGIGEGDEVIVPDLTFIATANAVLMAGATPVLVDIDPVTLGLDPAEVQRALTPRTRALLPVHLYGQSAALDALAELARRHGLHLLEDAAQAVGVRYRGRHAGTFGDIGVLSFYGNKTITTAEGGVLLTNDDNLARACFVLKNHGREVKGMFEHPHLGYNFSFTDLQAALGLAQLRKLPAIVAAKRRNLEYYRAELAGVAGIEFPEVPAGCEPVAWLANVWVDDPAELAAALLARGVQTRRFFYPLHRQPCYVHADAVRCASASGFPASEQAYARGLSLPSSATLTEADRARVVAALRESAVRRSPAACV